MPAHVRPEPGIATAVRHVATDPKVVPDRQPIAVPAGVELRARLGARPAQLWRDGATDLLHLAPRPARERMGVVGIVPRREGVDEAGHPAGQVPDRGEDAAHRREGAVRIDRLLEPGIVTADVAERQAIVRDVIAIVGRGDHAEWPKEPLADEVAVLQARGVGDHASEDPVAEVRILEPRARGPGEADPAAQELARTGRAAAPAGGRPTGRRSGVRPTSSAGRRWSPAGSPWSAGVVPARSGTQVSTGSSSRSRPSSRRSRTAAAVKLLVIDAIRKTLSASGAASAPTRSVPRPPEWTSSTVDDDPVGDARHHAAGMEPVEDRVDLGERVGVRHRATIAEALSRERRPRSGC